MSFPVYPCCLQIVQLISPPPYSLPFIEEVNAGLGIAVKTYLDELANDQDPTSKEAKEEQKRKLPEMFAQAYDINEDVARAFRLWDAVSLPFYAT